jgi:hypothetical protein
MYLNLHDVLGTITILQRADWILSVACYAVPFGPQYPTFRGHQEEP